MNKENDEKGKILKDLMSIKLITKDVKKKEV